MKYTGVNFQDSQRYNPQLKDLGFFIETHPSYCRFSAGEIVYHKLIINPNTNKTSHLSEKYMAHCFSIFKHFTNKIQRQVFNSFLNQELNQNCLFQTKKKINKKVYCYQNRSNNGKITVKFSQTLCTINLNLLETKLTNVNCFLTKKCVIRKQEKQIVN